MFEVPYYRGFKEWDSDYHDAFQARLMSRRDEFCVPDNVFYGTGYSTIRSNNKLHKEYPDFGNFINQQISCFDDKLEITHCWVNINPKGAYQIKHNHAFCDMAGTYYLKVPPEDSGYIKFYNPSPAVEAMHIHRPYHPEQHLHIPTETDLLFWPGYLDHEVLYNHSDEERWTVSFLMSLNMLDRMERFPSMLDDI